MLNQCQFIGNLGRDPETRYTADGAAICNFSIACNESWKDKVTGERKERTEWIRCAVFGKLAEICSEYLKKGKLVFIQGRFQTRSWEKDGETKYSTEIVVDTMKMLGGPRTEGGDQGDAPAERPQRQTRPEPAKATPAQGSIDDLDEDVPF